MWGNLIWTSVGINSLFKAALKWRKQRKCSLWHFNASVLFFFFFLSPRGCYLFRPHEKNIKCHIRMIFFTSILDANRFHKQSRPLIWVMLVVALDSCKYVTEQKTRRGQKTLPVLSTDHQMSTCVHSWDSTSDYSLPPLTLSAHILHSTPNLMMPKKDLMLDKVSI